MTNLNYCTRTVALLAGLAILASWPSAVSAQTVDDNFLLTTSVSPNVLLLLDNSGEMNQIEWHPAFDPDVVPAGCANWNDSLDYTFTSTAKNASFCGNVRDIFAPNNPTLWSGRYLNWYFSDAADPYVTEINTAKATPAGCNSAGSGVRFVSKYRRTRADAARQVILDVLCLSEPRGLRFGLARFRAAADAASEDPNGGYISVAVNDPSPAHAANLEAAVGNTQLLDAKPLSETDFQLYTYLKPRDATQIPLGADGVTSFPKTSYNLKGDVETMASKSASDPV
jgi:hypothetical protein